MSSRGVEAVKGLGIKYNVRIRIIDEPTGQLVSLGTRTGAVGAVSLDGACEGGNPKPGALPPRGGGRNPLASSRGRRPPRQNRKLKYSNNTPPASSRWKGTTPSAIFHDPAPSGTTPSAGATGPGPVQSITPPAPPV